MTGHDAAEAPANGAPVERPQPGRLGRLWSRLKAKGVRYWITAFVILVLATTGSPYVYDYLHLRDARSSFFQKLLEWGPRRAEPKFLRIVLIDNKEYWLGDLAGRRPINRRYLAALVTKLTDANVRLIAIDFDVRLPKPDTLIIPNDYAAETKDLIDAIKNAAARSKKIVLATPISFDKHYRRDTDIYQAYGLCLNGASWGAAAPPPPEIDKNITCGYIALPYDPLTIPGQLRLADGSLLDSFALAIARADQPELTARMLKRIGSSVRYGSYIAEQTMKEAGRTISAGAVRRGEVPKEKLNGKAVIIGADWSRDAFERGPRADVHRTPVGPIVGAMLHANYVEAMLDDRIFGAVPEWLLHATEILFGLIAGFVFAIIANPWQKVAGIVALLLILFLVTWLTLHSFGIFFDALVPVLGLGLHSLYERLLAPEHAAQHET